MRLLNYFLIASHLLTYVYSVIIQTKLNEDTIPDVVSDLNEVRDNKQLLDKFLPFFQTFFQKLI
jgi:hypothetical protein